MISETDKNYSGLYAEHGATQPFQTLCCNIADLKRTLKNEKYDVYFRSIQEALEKWHELIKTNHITDVDGYGIDVTIDMLATNTILQLNQILKQIRGKKEIHTITNKASDMISLIYTVKRQCYAAINSKKPPAPALLIKKSNTAPMAFTDTQISALQKSTRSPLHKIFIRPFFYYNKTAMASVCFFISAIASLGQSLIEFLMIDLGEIKNKNKMTLGHIGAYLALPIFFGALSIVFYAFALIASNCARACMIEKNKHRIFPKGLPKKSEEIPLLLERGEVKKENTSKKNKTQKAFDVLKKNLDGSEEQIAMLRDYLQTAKSEDPLAIQIRLYFNKKDINPDPTYHQFV